MSELLLIEGAFTNAGILARSFRTKWSIQIILKASATRTRGFGRNIIRGAKLFTAGWYSITKERPAASFRLCSSIRTRSLRQTVVIGSTLRRAKLQGAIHF